MQKNSSSSVPFLARYLEAGYLAELSEKEMDDIQGGIRYGYRDSRNIVHTLKYPSDSEDSNSSYHSSIGKYVSDRKDIDSDGYWKGKKYKSDIYNAIVVTHKYPSDSDDFGADF
ncbi:microviridin/marinostatin family tricyclic proteinase inhibitor [Rivularia sp. PCC 7116]|uniref:microviridin/marinostatin family tricyclic proteinase inhibitor n=1 Tax=Rivularia sp. PCC 7116 TaxID=373994 RepID=UPI001E62556B|nr:microviridin/marinostatin family tricyclic proteinase inhibitor [Rivularia sp. PCC 7116]